MITSAEEFVRLRTSSDPDEYTRAAHDSADVAVWETVIRDYPEMREWVAHNKTVPVEILEKLSFDEDERVRWSVAMKRKAPANVLERLAQDPDEVVRVTVAKNPKVPRYILERLANDTSWVVRDAAKERLRI